MKFVLILALSCLIAGCCKCPGPEPELAPRSGHWEYNSRNKQIEYHGPEHSIIIRKSTNL